MKVIELKTAEDVKQVKYTPQTIVLGYFDGVHLGHQLVIANGKKLATTHNEPLAVMSFDQQPSQFFNAEKQPNLLTNRRQKIVQLEKLGVDVFYIVSFNQELANLTPNQFVDNYLLPLGVRHIVVGFDYRFGKRASGDIYTLKALERNRYVVTSVDCIELENEKISSSAIRQALLSDDIQTANRLLGRAYELDGKVVHGDARGRTIGFPTANIEWDFEQLLPMEGVYVVEIKIKGQWYKGMASIGRNVTFERNRRVTVEVNIFDFNQDIYGEHVTVRWHKRLRKEIKFNHVTSLIRQLNQDKHDVKQFFSTL